MSLSFFKACCGTLATHLHSNRIRSHQLISAKLIKSAWSSEDIQCSFFGIHIDVVERWPRESRCSEALQSLGTSLWADVKGRTWWNTWRQRNSKMHRFHFSQHGTVFSVSWSTYDRLLTKGVSRKAFVSCSLSLFAVLCRLLVIFQCKLWRKYPGWGL